MRNVNEYDLYSVDFTRSLPPTLKDDPEINALGRAIAGQLQITAQQIRRNIIYARIDELDEQTLDILAYDLHVDWYDHSYPIEVFQPTSPVRETTAILYNLLLVLLSFPLTADLFSSPLYK